MNLSQAVSPLPRQVIALRLCQTCREMGDGFQVSFEGASFPACQLTEFVCLQGHREFEPLWMPNVKGAA